MSDKTDRINRRNFVKGGLTVVAAASCLSIGLKEAIALSRVTGKEVLTADNINRLLARVHREGKIKALASEISRDIKGWLHREFTTTSIQAKRIASVSDWSQIKKVLKFVEEAGATLTVSVIDSDGRSHHASAPAICRVRASATNGTTTVAGEAELQT